MWVPIWVNLDAALALARQSPSRVTGWRGVGWLSCSPPLGVSVPASELTAKLANYDRTDKISVDRSFARSLLSVSVRCGERWEPGNL